MRIINGSETLVLAKMLKYSEGTVNTLILLKISSKTTKKSPLQSRVYPSTKLYAININLNQRSLINNVTLLEVEG